MASIAGHFELTLVTFSEKVLARLSTLCWQALLLTLFGFAVRAQASNLIVEQSYWEDPSQRVDIEQVQRAPFKPFRGLMFRGYTSSATWVKIHLNPNTTSDATTALVLRVRPVYLDRIESYDTLDGAKVPQVTGDQYPFNANALGTLSHAFLVPATYYPRDLYLRLSTTSTSLLKVDAFNMTEFYKVKA